MQTAGQIRAIVGVFSGRTPVKNIGTSITATMARLLARVRDGYHGVTPLLAALVLAYTATCMAWGVLKHRQAYSEPVSWVIAFQDLDKERDFRALYLFAAVTAGAYLLLSVTFR